MKKYYRAIVICLLGLIFVACGKNEEGMVPQKQEKKLLRSQKKSKIIP